MKTAPDQLKEVVRKRYAEIARQDVATNRSSCCGAGANSNKVYNIMTDDYSDLKGYQADADLGLGCGLPTQFAHISEGDTVIDLGSGAGNDCFVARHETGATGKVLGIDFTTEMVGKARHNAEKMGFNNVEFRMGDIEEMPVTDETADVVVSNCVLNLVPNKAAVFGEIFRVLKKGGHFSISDVVLQGDLPEPLRQDAEMYAGCVSGAIQEKEYLTLIEQTGFVNITIQKRKVITIPDDILAQHLNAADAAAFKAGKTGIFSITVFAAKPGAKPVKPKIQVREIKAGQCSPNSGCC